MKIVGPSNGFGPELVGTDMSHHGFLRRNVETPLCEHFVAAGALCSLTTNCEQVLKAARTTFFPAISPETPVDFSVRFWVDHVDRAEPPWPKPFARGLGDLVFAGFDPRSSLLANLRTRHVIGRFSSGMASDTGYWKMVIFPMLLSILAGSVGLVELHASCVASGEQGLILLGPSCSGKSTLAMALTEAGFRFLSDDRTFCSLKHRRLQAWGLPRPLKLRRDSRTWFDDLRGREPSDVQNGERVFHVYPGPRRIAQCEPRLLLLLERENRPGFAMTPTTCSQVRSYIEQDLLAESHKAVQRQEETLNHLLSVPCFMLRYGGRPQPVAAQLASAFLNKTNPRSSGQSRDHGERRGRG
jgi:hypothetical protein